MNLKLALLNSEDAAKEAIRDKSLDIAAHEADNGVSWKIFCKDHRVALSLAIWLNLVPEVRGSKIHIDENMINIECNDPRQLNVGIIAKTLTIDGGYIVDLDDEGRPLKLAHAFTFDVAIREGFVYGMHNVIFVPAIQEANGEAYWVFNVLTSDPSVDSYVRNCLPEMEQRGAYAGYPLGFISGRTLSLRDVVEKLGGHIEEVLELDDVSEGSERPYYLQEEEEAP